MSQAQTVRVDLGRPLVDERPSEDAVTMKTAPEGEEQPAEPPGEQPSGPVPERPRSFLRRRPVASVIALALLGTTVLSGSLYWDDARRFQTTDDAFIAARQFAVAPKVAGYITAVPVTDNQHVAVGDVIARIDDRDYKVALADAEAQVAAAQAGVEDIDAQIDVQGAQVAASKAQLEQNEAKLIYAQQSATRYGTLTKEGWSSQQTGELANAELYQQRAAVATSKANLTVAQRQFEALKAQRENAVAHLREAKSQRDQAKLNLSYTTVTAAQPGRVVQLGAAVGEYAQAGTALTMFVPDKIWVVANFKETQIDAMRPGQSATFEIDAYPERRVVGHVASVQPGSGTAFSLLPAENATGNYVKIVQRVPVKIVIDNPPTDVALGPGMSVLPTVRTDPQPSLYERLRDSL